jgi:hypothetical protein
VTPLVVIAAFRSDAEADAARRMLAEEGVAADVFPRSASFERRCDDAFDDGFDVVVEPDRADAAIAIVQSLFPEPAALAQPPEICRDCGSQNIARLHRVRWFVAAAVVLLTIGVLIQERELFTLVVAIIGGILLLSPNRRCRSCGARWTAEHRVAPENAVAPPEVSCPKCESVETEPMTRRKEKALTLLVNLIAPPLLFVWPFLSKRRCATCGHEWR